MKILLITDTHWGVRNDSPVFLDYLKKSVDDVLLPYVKENPVDAIIHLGDLVDRRKYINFVTLNRLKKDFIEPINNLGVPVHIIAGNHDEYYKNTYEINALRELVADTYNNITIYSTPATVEFDGVPILLLPWITQDGYEQSIEAIKNSPAQICMGHLELYGFEMFKGSVSDHGMDHNVFSRYDLVCSGHYHHKSLSGNICYLGAFAEYIWSDYNDPRGFSILDTSTRELTFIQNTVSMFEKIWYDDLNKSMEDTLLFDPAEYKNKIVKVIIKNKTNPYWFDIFIEKLERAGTYELQVVEDHLHLDLQEDTDIAVNAEDTLTIFNKYIGQLNGNFNKPKLEKCIKDLYSEALSIE